MTAPVEWTRGEWTVSTDRARLDRELTARTLASVYWSPGIPREVVEGAIDHSLCFGLYRADAGQIGFARFVTDYYTFAYLCDVFVLESERGQGAGKFLIECVMAYPGLDRLRRLLLVTRDAHELYRPHGFAELEDPKRMMQIMRPRIYEQKLELGGVVPFPHPGDERFGRWHGGQTALAHQGEVGKKA